jgi:hypothetical protein
MAFWRDPTAEEVEDWAAWVAERPMTIREMVLKYGFSPWKLYLLKTSGHRVIIHSFDKPADGAPPTLKVIVSGEYNFVAFERTVFGILPEDLEECDLPGPEERVGSANMTVDEVHTVMREASKSKPS